MRGVPNAPGPSLTLGLLGPSHQWCHKSRASLRGPPCAHGVAGTPQGEVRDIDWAGFPFWASALKEPGLSHPLQVPPLWYISLNGGNCMEAFNLALARVTMHQPHMGHTHVRLALNFLCHQSKLGTYPQSPLLHLLVDRGWLGADFHTCPRPS